MHPDLSPHLHTDECNAIIAAFNKCHKENPFKKFLGACNDLDRALNKCVKRELETRRLQNNKKGAHRKSAERAQQESAVP